MFSVGLMAVRKRKREEKRDDTSIPFVPKPRLSQPKEEEKPLFKCLAIIRLSANACMMMMMMTFSSSVN